MAFKTHKPTKADSMRAFIAQRRAEGQTTRPIEIVAEMEKRGITVSSGQASVVLRKFNKRRRNISPRAPKTGREVTVMVDGRPRKLCGLGNGAPKMQVKDYASLMLASQFARTCGGITQAKKMLGELEQIVDPFIRS